MMLSWIHRDWWAYVFDDSRADSQYGPWYPYLRVYNPWTGDWFANPLARVGNWLARCLCRWRGHPAGVYWYSGSMEPDMRCMGCGEDLG